MFKFNTASVRDYSVSAIKCDGTVNVSISLNPLGSGEYIDLYCLTIKQVELLEEWLTFKNRDISIDNRFLSQTDAQWLSQNGISQ
jgi:hypothetical protein